MQMSPHVLVFWRPDIHKFRAFVVQEAKPGGRGGSPLVLSCVPCSSIVVAGVHMYNFLTSFRKVARQLLVVLSPCDACFECASRHTTNHHVS